MNRGGVNLFSTSDRIAILITRPLERAWVDIRNVDSFREIERLIDKIQTQKKAIAIALPLILSKNNRNAKMKEK